MAAKKSIRKDSPQKLTAEQIAYLEGQMARLAERNPSWKIEPTDYKALFRMALKCNLVICNGIGSRLPGTDDGVC